MPHSVRLARYGDIPRLIELLLTDAKDRAATDSALWKLSDTAATDVERALIFALSDDPQPFRQIWQVAEDQGRITGVVHSMLLPVPPIYAGEFGEPGLILPDSFAATDAPTGTVDALVGAAETALQEAGAQITVASYVTGQDWQEVFQARGYDPLTLYLSRTDFATTDMQPGVRPAKKADVPGIVAQSAAHRQIIFDIDPFWRIHPEADQRFSAWMTRSLTLPDRDMFVTGADDAVTGYVIAQPATRLHFPPAHEISRTGVIDDFYHTDLADRDQLAQEGIGATALMRAAEAAFEARGIGTAFVVCPAKWGAKVKMLEAAGYRTAMLWSIKGNA